MFPSNLKLNVWGVDDLHDAHRTVEHEPELLTVIWGHTHTHTRVEDGVMNGAAGVWGALLTHYDGVDFPSDLQCGAVTAEDIDHLSELGLRYQQVMWLILVLLLATHTHTHTNTRSSSEATASEHHSIHYKCLWIVMTDFL